MSAEWLLFFGALILGLLPFLRRRGRVGWRIVMIGVVLSALAVYGANKWHDRQQRRSYARSQYLKSVPREGRPGGYVSSDNCQSCHPDQHASWHRSYHRTMTQYATPETVRGNFTNVTLNLAGESYKLERRGDEFWVELVDPDWKLQAMANPGQRPRGAPRRVWRQIGIMTGSHHMQAYWVPSAQGNLQLNLPLSYLFADERWVPRNDTFLMDPKDPAPVQLWNANCLQCHSTAGQPRPETNNPSMVNTRVAEIGIACEACHGPAERHVHLNKNPVHRYAQHRDAEGDPTIVNPAKLDHKRSSQVCGQCHSIKSVAHVKHWPYEGFAYRPGDDLEKHFPIVRPLIHTNEGWFQQTVQRDARFVADRYWSDGMVRVSGREYNGLLETPCFQKGTMSCLSCHSLHRSDPDDQLAAKMDSNQACLQCHEEVRVPEHTKHAAGSSGSSCYNCHMPHTTYGLLKAIRSHTVDSPSVQSTLRTGRPNACNLCHLDKPLAWTARHLNEWYGHKLPGLSSDEQSISAAALWALRGDAGQRALLAWHMGWEPARKASGDQWISPYLAQLLEDPYSTVRYIAHRSLKSISGFGDFAFDYIAPPEERAQAHERAMGRWEQRRSGSRTGSELLIQPDGTVDRVTWRRLLGERDNKSMYLQE